MSRDKFGVRYPLITGVSDQYRTNQQLVGETNTIDPASQLLTQEAAGKALSATGELEHVAIGIVSGVYKVEQAALADAGLPTDVQSGILAVISDTRSVTWNEDDRTGTATYLVRQNIYNDNTDNPTVYTRYGKLSVPVKRPLENPELVRPDWEAIIKPEGYQLAGTWSAWTTMGGSLRRILVTVDYPGQGRPEIVPERNVIYEVHWYARMKLPVPDLWPVGTKVVVEQWCGYTRVCTKEYDPETGIELNRDKYEAYVTSLDRMKYNPDTNDIVVRPSENDWETFVVQTATFEVVDTADGKHDWVMDNAPCDEATLRKLSQDIVNLRQTAGRGIAYHNLTTVKDLRLLEQLRTQFSTSKLQDSVTDRWNLYYYDQCINVSNKALAEFEFAIHGHIPNIPVSQIPMGAKITYVLEGPNNEAIETVVNGVYNDGYTSRYEQLTIKAGQTLVVVLCWSQVVFDDGSAGYDWVIQCAGS